MNGMSASSLLSKPVNVHLRGRKKFMADLSEMSDVARDGYMQHGMKISNLRAGDDEGSFECAVVGSDGSHIVSLSFIVSDTSEYPSGHNFICFASDEIVPASLMSVIEEIPSEGSRTIGEMLKKLLNSIARKATPRSDDEDEDEDEEGYNAYDSEDDFGVADVVENDLDIPVLQRDFNETVACGYRPGLIRFGSNQAVLSVSLPVIDLARDIPARALMAWDRRLLSKTQHLTLLITGLRGRYPVLQADGTYDVGALGRGTSLQFKVGLSSKYKPNKQHVMELVRNYGLMDNTEDIAPQPATTLVEDSDSKAPQDQDEVPSAPDVEEEQEDDGQFHMFSLSASLETLLNHYFFRVLQLRIKYHIGWAGAEVLCWESERSQEKPENVCLRIHKAIRDADMEEMELANSYNLPPDPLFGLEQPDHLNLPLLTFCYLLRRLTLCPRYCLVCHRRLVKDYEALKPYVCDEKLCIYQYYKLNFGPSLEYEICVNPEVVDLLVSLAYVAAANCVLEKPLPVGMDLRVPIPMYVVAPARSRVPAPAGLIGPPVQQPPVRIPVVTPGYDGLCEFDSLHEYQMNAAVKELIDRLPSIADMKAHLERKLRNGRAKPKLRDMNPSIPDAAWSILRWCVASCTAYLEELTSEEEKLRGIDRWRQFRFSVGAPDAEAKFRAAVTEAQKIDPVVRDYPSLYAWHGSSAKHWNSIIRHGLWYKEVVNGRAHGHGIYFSKDGNLSMTTYAHAASMNWSNSGMKPQKCVALAEIVNLPKEFVSSQPFFVVAQTHWIVCRYLLVLALEGETPSGADMMDIDVPLVQQDPRHPIMIGPNKIQIPEPSYKLELLLSARRAEYTEESYDEEDLQVFSGSSTSTSQAIEPATPVEDEWTHDPEWVSATIEHMMPAPVESSPMAIMALQKELKRMLKEQENSKSLKELGWYIPTDFIGDNLFQWIVELHSLEKELPIAIDMKARGVNSLVIEIRFPPTYPHSPPFFRIIKPRFLPFIQGGGGHVTGGGSLCMDLLTADGWLPSYSISAVLLQIRLAISNLDPRPARLSSNWDSAYGMQESLEGFKRAATNHGWKIPSGLERLVR